MQVSKEVLSFSIAASLSNSSLCLLNHTIPSFLPEVNLMEILLTRANE